MLAFDGNTAPYLQYAHARICSIFRRADVDRERRAIGARSCSARPRSGRWRSVCWRCRRALDETLASFSPHKLCSYLFDLSQDFTAFYEHCPVLRADEPLRTSRLALCDLSPGHSLTAWVCSASKPLSRCDDRYVGLVSALARRLLPDTADVGADGWLRIGGCSIQRAGRRVRHAAVRLRRGAPAGPLPRGGRRVRPRACRLRHQGLPVPGDGTPRVRRGHAARRRHRGELHVALAAGVPASACVLHGNNKSVAELREAIAEGVRHIVVDSFDELDRLDALAHGAAPDPRPTCCCGSRPGSTPTPTSSSPPVRTTRSSASTSATATPSGPSSGRRRSDSVNLVGLHCHIGSNVFAASSFAMAAEVMAGFAAPLGLARARARRRARRRLRRHRGGARRSRSGRTWCSTPARRSACGRT